MDPVLWRTVALEVINFLLFVVRENRKAKAEIEAVRDKAQQAANEGRDLTAEEHAEFDKVFKAYMDAAAEKVAADDEAVQSSAPTP